jgi:hypothetical protein
MPLSEHEQRILDEIEQRLREEDPRLVEQVTTTSLYTHLARRIRWASLGFFVGFMLLVLGLLELWVGVAGFVLMLTSALLVYQYLKRMGRDQRRAIEGRGWSLPAILARLSGRFRRPDPEEPPSG